MARLPGEPGSPARARRPSVPPVPVLPAVRVGTSVMLAALVLVAGCAGPLSGAARSPAAPTATVPIELKRAKEVVVAQAVGSEVVAYAEPSKAAPVKERLTSPTANGGPLVFEVVTVADRWLEVLLPVRPNGTLGWISIDSVSLSRDPYRVEIDMSDHRLTVLQANIPIEQTKVAIGTGATPTPVGTFYLTELLRAPDPSGIYGPYAFGLSGYSETLDSFNGGDGVIGIHGTNEPDSLGRDVSHGCVRVANDVIAGMAAYLPLGTPVIITA